MPSDEFSSPEATSPHFAKHVSRRVLRYEVPYNPPPSIAHVLLLTAAASFAVAMAKWFAPQDGESVGLSGAQLAGGMLALVLSPGIAGMWLAMWRRLRGIRFPAQPGEWLLCLYGWAGLSSFAQWIALSLLWPRNRFESGYSPVFVFTALQIFFIGVSAVVYLWLGWRGRYARPWAIAFRIHGTFRLLQAFPCCTSILFAGVFSVSANRMMAYLPWFIHLAEGFLFVMLIAIAAREDRYAGVDRGWTHRFGMIYFMVAFVATVGYTVAQIMSAL
ncbi:MAG: hypothetical protein KDA42_13705 [Planctomycetales bacterium]|nr:hypothetical protein [Planctomycetales bacterium]